LGASCGRATPQPREHVYQLMAHHSAPDTSKARESARLEDGGGCASDDERSMLAVAEQPAPAARGRSGCGSCCTVYERFVAVLLPLSSLVDLASGASVGWTWGIAVGVIGVVLSAPVVFDVFTSLRTGSRPVRDMRTTWTLYVLTTLASLLWPYVLVTALVQVSA
jgi:hypothetical protein